MCGTAIARVILEMNEKPTLKKTRNFYNLEDYNPQNSVETSQEFLEDPDCEAKEMIEDEYAKAYIGYIVAEHVKVYCEEHFEEIIAAAIMLHEAKKKRKQVKAFSLTFKTEKSNK